jgi:hypothetical protein
LPFKLATHGVAIEQTSLAEITEAIISYFLALLHMHSFVRETMWWWLALAKKKMC